MSDDTTQTTVTERDMEMGREACAALARATWFAEYLERKFAAVRAEERARCAAIAHENILEWNEAGWMACAEEILRRIESGI